jgi:hypothetical protein
LACAKRESNGSSALSFSNTNRRFKFHTRSRLFICPHDELLPVAAMRVSNPYRSPVGINRRVFYGNGETKVSGKFLISQALVGRCDAKSHSVTRKIWRKKRR